MTFFGVAPTNGGRHAGLGQRSGLDGGSVGVGGAP